MKSGLFVKIMQHMIRAYLRSSYQRAHQRFALRVILKTVLDEQRYEFREDNEVTTLAYVIEQAVRSSRVKKDWAMTKKIMDIVGETDWDQDFTS